MIAISSFKLKAVTTATACVALGAAAGIVGASAAPGSKSVRPGSQLARPRLLPWAHGARPGLRRLPGGPVGPAVHATVVVLNKARTGFITITLDNGTVQSVSGNTLTLKEAVGKVTYRTVTLTIPTKPRSTGTSPRPR